MDLDADPPEQVPCTPGVRPENSALSCDAAGCHGSYDYDASTPVEDRHLHGGEGPSCWTCHDQEWDPARDIAEVQ